MNLLDTNINNYTDNELITILNNPTNQEELENITNKYISRFQTSNPDISIFFKDIQNRLLPTFETRETLNDQTDDWIDNLPALTQSDTNQSNKITDRNQKIDVYKDTHLPMGRQQLGVNNTYNVPVVQDKLNPNLENITSRLIMIDSTYRQGNDDSSTDFTCDLSDPLKNVLSLRLYSFQIPYSWYLLNETYGNTCFWVYNNSNYFQITMPSGNYTTTTFPTELITIMNNLGFTTMSSTNLYYTTSTGKITINLDGVTDPKGNAITGIDYVSTDTTIARIIFFDYSQQLTCNSTACNSPNNYSFNNTLGWIMGFRTASVNVLTTGNTGEGIFDYNGSKYFILVIDDLNQNHINNGLVVISNLNKKLKLPNYYTSDLPYKCNILKKMNIKL